MTFPTVIPTPDPTATPQHPHLGHLDQDEGKTPEWG